MSDQPWTLHPREGSETAWWVFVDASSCVIGEITADPDPEVNWTARPMWLSGEDLMSDFRAADRAARWLYQAWLADESIDAPEVPAP